MKCSKTDGLSDIIAEILKAAGDKWVELGKELAEAVFSSSEIPADWAESFILGKGKVETLDGGN